MPAKVLHVLNRIVTLLFYIVFIALVLWLAAGNHPGLVKTIVVCGVSFVLVSAFRHCYNAPRPYEKAPAIPPPKANCQKGRSFPSRHVFCAFLIAVTVARFFPVAGVTLLCPALLLAWLRNRLHYHSAADVIWGAVTGACCGIIGFWVI